jgi:hypothetical protein
MVLTARELRPERRVNSTGRPGRVRRNSAASRVPGEPGQDDIAEKGIDMELGVQAHLQRLLRVAGGVHVVARFLENAAHDVAYPVLVFGDDDPAATAAGRGDVSEDGLTRWTRGSGRQSDSHGGALVGL